MSTTGINIDQILGENLRILTQAMADICQRSTLDEASGGQLTTKQFAILRILARREHLTASEFARIMGISPAAVTKNIDRLAALGLISRSENPQDRRSTVLTLEAPGQEMLDRHDEISGHKIASILIDFSPTEKTQLLDFIQRIVQHTLSDEQDADIICYQCGGRCGHDCVVEQRKGTCSLHRTGGP